GLIELNLIPDEFVLLVRIYNYKAYIGKLLYKTVQKPNDKLLKLDDIATTFFNQHFSEESIVDSVDGSIVISEKAFNKEYNKKIQPLKEWLEREETLKYVNNMLLESEYETLSIGSLSEWEMQSLSFYYNEHELTSVDND